MPFNRLMGMRLVRTHSDGVTIECPVRADLMNTFGVLHGGVTATLADAAVGIALARHFGGSRPATTVEMKINYLRPVTQGRVVARATLLRVGATLCVARVDLSDADDNAIAAALITYMLLKP